MTRGRLEWRRPGGQGWVCFLVGTGDHRLDGMPMGRTYAEVMASLGSLNTRRAALGLAPVTVREDGAW
jgi:hypothetical protein